MSEGENGVGNAARFKVGDVVALKSGGPAMTVSGVLTSGMVLCVWFGPVQDDARQCMVPPDAIIARAPPDR